jgi:hypothetical protein
VQRSPQLLLRTAVLELEICHCSNKSFEQWIFLPCQALQENLFYAKKGLPQNLMYCGSPLLIY